MSNHFRSLHQFKVRKLERLVEVGVRRPVEPEARDWPLALTRNSVRLQSGGCLGSNIERHRRAERNADVEAVSRFHRYFNNSISPGRQGNPPVNIHHFLRNWSTHKDFSFLFGYFGNSNCNWNRSVQSDPIFGFSTL